MHPSPQRHSTQDCRLHDTHSSTEDLGVALMESREEEVSRRRSRMDGGEGSRQADGGVCRQEWVWRETCEEEEEEEDGKERSENDASSADG